MPIIKYAETQFTSQEIQHLDFTKSEMLFQDVLLQSNMAKSDEKIRQRFMKFAHTLKKVAPRAKDFLYFSAIMMHAAEAALVDQNTGELIIHEGTPLNSEWEIHKKSGSWKWKCSNPNIRPYKNNNGDIFPESELKLAYRKWIGRPLCKDHQSGSVDGIRGIIVDTYYDDKRKRVIALCALDKINYPDLARKVSTGYATNVSMGTAVGRSICFECGNIAKVEADYCEHVRNRTTYGEINVDLSPIELSLVVTGADPRAQLKNVIASLNKYSEEKNDRIQDLRKAGCVTPVELEKLERELEDLKRSFNGAMSKAAAINVVPNLDEATRVNTLLQNSDLSEEARKNLLAALDRLLTGNTEKPVEVQPTSATQSTVEMGDTGKGYVGQGNDTGPPEWSMEGNRLASTGLDHVITNINNKLGAMELALRDMAIGVQEATKHKEEQSMSGKELRERAAARRAMFNKSAYHLGGGGVNDPASLPYPVDPLNEKLKTKGDKQMEGQGMEPGNDGLHPGYDSFGESEESLKKKLSRAELDGRKAARHSLMKEAEGQAEELDTKKTQNGNTIAKLPDGKVVMLNNDDGTFQEIDDAQIQTARDILKAVGKGAKKEAYWQGGGGVNEPQTYPVDGLNDQLKTKGDKQMEGQGMEPGNDGMHPGYQSYGNEEALKKKLLRAQLRAKFIVAYNNEDKTVIDKENSRWEIYAGPEKILEATGREIYEDELEDNWEVLASKKWGREVLRAIREDGLGKVAFYLKGEGFTKEAQPPMPGLPPMPGPDAGPGPEGPLPGGPEDAPEKDEKPVDEDPIKAALSAASEHLEEVEKSLGDLEKAYEEKSGEKSDEADLDTVGLSEADDGATVDFKELYSGLDESADELAMLAESLDGRLKSGRSIDDPITAELLRLTEEAVEASTELRSQASLFINAKKGKKEDEEKKSEKKSDKEDKKSDKKDDKKSEKKDDKKSDKKEDKKDDKKDDKKSDKEEKKFPFEKGKKSDKEEKKFPFEKGKKSDKEDEEKDDKKGKKSKAELLVEDLLRARANSRRGLAREAAEGGLDEAKIEALIEKKLEELFAPLGGPDGFVSEEKEEEEHGPEGTMLEVGEEEVEDMDALDAELAQMLDDFEADDALETQASARRAWREKVASEVGAKYQMSLDSQTTVDTDMPIGKSFPLGQLDTKHDEAVVEGIVEMHEEILKQVQNLPKVREAMEHLGGLLKSGQLKLADLEDANKLKALAVDPEAAKYWKSYFGEGDKQCKQFGTELTKEYTNKKIKASLDEEKVRMRRAYDIALSMQDKGLISDDVSALHAQVDEIMTFDDKSFESYKRALSRVSKTSHTKTAAPALNVGMGSDELGEGVDSPVNLTDQLNKLFG